MSAYLSSAIASHSRWSNFFILISIYGASHLAVNYHNLSYITHHSSLKNINAARASTHPTELPLTWVPPTRTYNLTPSSLYESLSQLGPEGMIHYFYYEVFDLVFFAPLLTALTSIMLTAFYEIPSTPSRFKFIPHSFNILPIVIYFVDFIQHAALIPMLYSSSLDKKALAQNADIVVKSGLVKFNLLAVLLGLLAFGVFKWIKSIGRDGRQKVVKVNRKQAAPVVNKEE
ncbi:hypothetical protein BKA69DRAFT_1080142 [Paraphysoderma sedebokerense]|nr:hypothetical protein BKA69DRAFT_1080142 [Paraphysoderma sedebokerense]